MADPAAHRQRDLVAHLQATHALTDPAVAEAFLAVGRHHFLPGLPLDQVYADEAIPTKHADGFAISSSSQPAIMAIMLEQLQVAPGQRILEIGAGTGYNAALLGHLVGMHGHVTALDLDEDIVTSARQHLAAAGAANVTVVQADGAFGWPAGAPYDRVILTVGAWDIAPAWHAQLRPGGRLVLPLEMGPGSQKSLALIRPADPSAALWFESDSLRDCGFMRLRGALAGPEVVTALGPEPGFHLSTVGPSPASAAQVYAWLLDQQPPLGSGVHASARELWGAIGLWLGLHTPNVCSLSASEGLGDRGLIPCLFEFGRQPPTCITLGAIAPQGLGLLGRAPHAPRDGHDDEGRAVFELFVHPFGPKGGHPARQVAELLAAWERAGRPGSTNLRVRVLPRPSAYSPAPGEILYPKRFTDLVIDWPPAPAAAHPSE